MIEAVLPWLPLILFGGIFLFVGRRQMATYYTHVDQVNAVNQRIVDTNELMIAELKAIHTTLKERS